MIKKITTAKEMFEELGYSFYLMGDKMFDKFGAYKYSFGYKCPDSNAPVSSIDFWSNTCRIFMGTIRECDDKEKRKKLGKAILKQVEELGWENISRVQEELKVLGWLDD